ncbi:MAG: Xaa-Pro peptidase family protein [Candidatus Kerfeldbacteria bacterium]|nr:Xaa-Pro peptidase family protein [Candidatus Kerfeldbacteria bacterium]
MKKLLYSSSSHDANMLYAVKVEIPDPFYFLDLGAGEKKYIFLDAREYGVFQEANTNPLIECVLTNALGDELKKISVPAGSSRGARLGAYIAQKYALLNEPVAVPSIFPLQLADELRACGMTLQPTEQLYPERLTKRDDEVTKIEDALKRTHSAFKRIEEILRASKIEGDVVMYKGKPLTSELLKLEVERAFVEVGVMNVEGIIISCGPHAAIPHHRGAGVIRAHQTIICDIFPRNMATGYFADMTRTYVKGEPSTELRKMYDAVKLAQERGIAAARPGVAGKDVHQACVDTFAEHGFVTTPDEGFIHGTGHGLGLDVHELPYAAAGQAMLLHKGNVITVEPGLYYPKYGGVRIEDVIVITDTGARNLTNYHKEWIIA